MRLSHTEALARPPYRGVRRRQTVACVSLAFAVTASCAIRAAESDVVEMNPLTIAGTRETGERADELHGVLPAPRPGGAGGLPSLASHVAGLPGVIAQESFGGFDPPRLTLRGSGLQSAPVSRGVWWTLDGLPLNAVDGTFTSAVIDPSLVAQIGVAAGATDPVAAVTALGGALHLTSPAPEARTQAWTTFGPDGYIRMGAHLPDVGACLQATPSNESPASRLLQSVSGGFSYAAWDGWRPQSAQERVALAGALGARLGGPGPALRLALYTATARLDVPGPLTKDAALRHPDTVSALVAADRPRRETEFARLALDLTWTHDAQDCTRLALAAQHTDDWFRQLRANGISETAGTDLSLLLEMRRSLGHHALHAGLLTRAGSRDQTRWLNSAGATGAAFAEVDLDAGHAVLWVDDRCSLTSDLTLEAGLSFVDATRDAGGTPTGAHGRFADQAMAPRLALAWQAGEHLHLTARATRGLEAATFDDLLATRGPPSALALTWTPLRAQRSDTLELGARGEPGPVAWSVTAYTARWKNELLRLAGADGAPLGTVNAGDTAHAGLETALRWRIRRDGARALDLTLAHTWNCATFEEDPAYRGRDLAGLPPQAGSAQLSWAGDHGPFAIVGASWIGGTTWADHANTLGYSGYTLANLRLGWADRRGWSVFAEVDNLLDRAIIASTSGVIDLARNPTTTALFLPGLPRQVRVGFSWTR